MNEEKDLIRVEIVYNQTLLENIIERFEKYNVGHKYTVIPTVHGKGRLGEKLGNAVWPEENSIMIIFTDLEKAKTIRMIVDEIIKKHPDDGINVYYTKCFDI